MPSRMLRSPCSASVSTIVSSMGTRMSKPSIEKRCLPGKMRWMKCSKTSTSVSWFEQIVRVGRSGELAGFDGVAQPFAFFGQADVIEVEAAGRRVDAAQRLGRFERVAGGWHQRSADQTGGQSAQVVGGDAMHTPCRVQGHPAAACLTDQAERRDAHIRGSTGRS